MEKLTAKLSESILDKLSMDFLRNQVLKNAYGNDDTVIATHDMQLVCQWAERIVVLCGGRVVADGPRDEIFARTDVVKQVGIRPPEIFTMAQALDEQALCYTVQEFLDRFQEG